MDLIAWLFEEKINLLLLSVYCHSQPLDSIQFAESHGYAMDECELEERGRENVSFPVEENSPKGALGTVGS